MQVLRHCPTFVGSRKLSSITPPPRKNTPELRQRIVNVVSVLTAMMVPIMFNSAAEARDMSYDRLVDIEEQVIPEMITKINKDNVANKQQLASFMSVVEQIEDEITELEQDDVRETSVHNTSVDFIESQLQMLQEMSSGGN
jgi:hypothetical protein